MSVSSCAAIRTAFLDALRDQVSPQTRETVNAHLAECPACAEEFRGLRQVWEELPTSVDVRPPAVLRERVLATAWAEDQETVNVWAGLWNAARAFVTPVLLGAAAAFSVVVLTHLRGTLAPLSQSAMVAVSLAFAASLAVVVGAVFKSRARRSIRAVLLGALGALGGYAVLSLVLPISVTFGWCRVILFGSAAISLGQVCLVYLVIAAVYAGVPLSIAVYAWSGSDPRWRTGFAEAAVFAILAAPVLVLQVGLDELMITGTLLLGLLAGSLMGGLAGTWARARWLVGATG